MLSVTMKKRMRRWVRAKKCREEVYRIYGVGNQYYAGVCGLCGYRIVTPSLEVDIRTKDGDAPKTPEGLYLEVYSSIITRCPQCRSRNVTLTGFPSLEAVNAFFECLENEAGK